MKLDNQTIIKSRINAIFVFVIILSASLFVVSFISSSKVNAAYGNMPNVLPETVTYPSDPQGQQYINLTDGDQDETTGYGANLADSFVKVYTDSPGAKKIDIDVVDRNAGVARACRNYFVEWHMYTLDDQESMNGPEITAGFFRVTRCVGEGGYVGYSFTIPANAFTASNKRGHEGLHVAMLDLRIVSESDGAHTATLKVKTDTTAHLGFAGDTYSTIYPSLNRPFPNTITAKFRTPCNLTPGRYTVTWEDDDQGEPNQLPQLGFFATQFDDAGNSQGTVVLGSPAWDRGSSTASGSADINIQPGTRYTIGFTNVTGGNGIAIKYPFDTGDWDLPCPEWDLSSVSTSVVNPWVEIGSSVNFSHSLGWTGNAPPDPQRWVSYNYAPSTLPLSIGPTTWRADATTQGGTIPSLTSPWAVNDNPNGTLKIDDNVSHIRVVQDFCQNYTVNPSKVDNGTIRRGSLPSTNACTRVVGGKTSPVATASTSQLIEGGEALAFVAKVNTSDYHNSTTNPLVTWPGYSVDCNWKLTRQIPGDIIRDISGQSGDCDNTITANGDGSVTRNISYTAPATEPIGTYICLVVQITGATSTATSASNPAFIGNPSSTPACNIVTAKPFVRAYQGDVVTGGHFGETGAQGSGKVDGYFRGTHAGSGSEFALIAAGSVGSISTSNGFASAFMRDLVSGTKPLPKDGLTFANNEGYDGTAGLGKYYDTASRTVEDFYKTTKEPKTIEDGVQDLAGNIIDQTKVTNPVTVIGEAANNNGQSWYKPAAGTMVTIDQITDIVINKSKKHTIYVDGDVLINQDITYQDGYANKDEIPYFSLIVKGNIFISSGVSRLDGRFIAQPKGVNNNDTTSGFIYTCTTPGTGVRYADNLLYNACQTKLTVNGTMTAQKIKFLRTNGTLRDIKYTPFDPGGAGYVAGIPSTDRLEFTNWGTSLQDAKDDTGKSNCYQIKEVAGTKDARVPGPGNWDGWGTWHDNYLCSDTPLNLVFHDGGQFNGTPDGSTERCSNAWGIGASDGGRNPLENQAPASQYWNDNFLCAPIAMEDIGLQFITGDTIPPGKDCELIAEPSDSQFTADMKRKICWNVLVPGSDSTPEKYEQLKYNTNGEAAGRKITAEEFRLTPEFLIGDPAFKPKPNGDPLNGRYDSIVTLPPIL